MFFQFRFMVTIAAIALLTFGAMMAMANQVGVNFSQNSVGGLGDYQKTLGVYEFEVDAQAQRADSLSLAANVSVERNFGGIGIKPFASYNRDDIGNTLDARRTAKLFYWRI